MSLICCPTEAKAEAEADADADVDAACSFVQHSVAQLSHARIEHLQLMDESSLVAWGILQSYSVRLLGTGVTWAKEAMIMSTGRVDSGLRRENENGQVHHTNDRSSNKE